jgi:hypothetical protein
MHSLGAGKMHRSFALLRMTNWEVKEIGKLKKLGS